MSVTDLAKEPTGSAEDVVPENKHLGLALFVIAAAQLMIVLDATIVNIALPKIQPDLHFSQAGLQWVVTAYALSLGSLLLLGGRLGDILGRRRMFMVGIGIFAVASLLGGIAPTSGLLITARVLQGVGAALAQPAALALINTTFPAGKERNRAMAVYAMMSGAGAAIGLILGGVLTEYHWRWTFLINVPIGLFVLYLAPRNLVESDAHEGRLDVVGAALGTLGLFGIVYGLSHAASHSWGEWQTIAPLVMGAVMIATFVVVEARTEHALLPMRIITDRNRGVSLLVMLLIGAAMFAMFFFLGLFIQQVLGYSPVKSGFAFLPFSVAMVLAAGTGQALAGRVDPRWIAGTGALFAATGMWGFTHLSPTSGYASHLLPYIIVLAFGMGLIFIPITLTATHGVAPKDAGAAASALNTMQQIGGAVGLAALTTVYSHYAKERAAELTAKGAAELAKVPAAVQQSPEFKAKMLEAKRQAGFDVQTYASTHGFWVACGMILVGALVIFAFLNAKHEDLSTDGAHGAHLG